MFELAETLAAAGRVLHRGRRRPAGRHRRRSASRASTASRSTTSAGSRASCRSSASTPAAASPATPRCSAAATSSSRRADSNIGMGGPAMIEGGGLGVFRPEEVGPIDVQVRERRRRRRGRRRGRGGARSRSSTSSYFQGALADWACADQRVLRARRSRRTACASTTCARVIETLADTGSVLELRRDFGRGMVTALARIEGRPLGVDRQQPDAPRRRDRQRRRRQGRALHAALRRLRPADPVPLRHAGHHGRARGREDRARAPRGAHVRRSARASRVPFFTIVLRKGYGLGAQAMAGGSFKAPLFTVAWPTGEFGGMGLEGAVKLGYPQGARRGRGPGRARRRSSSRWSRACTSTARRVNIASHFEIDDVIDPADSRRWIARALALGAAAARRARERSGRASTPGERARRP